MKYQEIDDVVYFEGDWNKETRRARRNFKIGMVAVLVLLLISSIQF